MGLSLTGEPGMAFPTPGKGWSQWDERFAGDGTRWEAMAKVKELGMEETEVAGGSGGGRGGHWSCAPSWCGPVGDKAAWRDAGDMGWGGGWGRAWPALHKAALSRRVVVAPGAAPVPAPVSLWAWGALGAAGG